MFLADKRIVHLLPKVLGKEFYKKHKQPMPVDLANPELQKEILRALRSTYMHFNYSDNCAVKIATTALNDRQAFENLITALPEIIKGVYGGADNIRKLHVKTADSTSLEIYNSEEAVEQENEEDEEDEDDDEF
ncbi:60S ribosomal protein L10A [Dichotomocladium elegans]|nr:60S ribosomal protein L10A [Dichotomocladium elegans]